MNVQQIKITAITMQDVIILLDLLHVNVALVFLVMEGVVQVRNNIFKDICFPRYQYGIIVITIILIFVIDINECTVSNKNTCNSQTQNCANTIGSFKCNCKNGYEQKNKDCVGRLFTAICMI